MGQKPTQNATEPNHEFVLLRLNILKICSHVIIATIIIIVFFSLLSILVENSFTLFAFFTLFNIICAIRLLSLPFILIFLVGSRIGLNYFYPSETYRQAIHKIFRADMDACLMMALEGVLGLLIIYSDAWYATSGNSAGDDINSIAIEAIPFALAMIELFVLISANKWLHNNLESK